jgi:glycosyltransferase involved in cell wall biosynthesis
MTKTDPMLSVVVPLLNEAGNLEPLHQKLTGVLQSVGQPYEIIFVNDGSTDGSAEVLAKLFAGDSSVQVIHFQQNFGKTAALTAGFRHSQGQVIITLDADLQDDPAEIPAMLDKLNQGYDLVAAWRHQRQDAIDKTLPSRLFNWAVSTFSRVRLHDFNCGFKVYRRSVTDQIPLYSDFHRLIPVLAASKGFRIAELPVQHHPRYTGISKYGNAGRMLRFFFDFITILFLMNYLKYPLRLFGTGGLIMFGLGGLIELYLAGLWLLRALGAAEVGPIGTRPLFTVGILAMILGIQLISTGLLGEMLRYFTFRPEQEYIIEKILRHDHGTLRESTETSEPQSLTTPSVE